MPELTQATALVYAVVAASCARRRQIRLGLLVALLTTTSLLVHRLPYDTARRGWDRTVLELDKFLARFIAGLFALLYCRQPALWIAVAYLAVANYVWLPQAKRRLREAPGGAEQGKKKATEPQVTHAGFHVVTGVAMTLLVLFTPPLPLA
jgi:phosphatidylserine synthase